MFDKDDDVRSLACFQYDLKSSLVTEVDTLFAIIAGDVTRRAEINNCVSVSSSGGQMKVPFRIWLAASVFPR